jgi:hypothetical protein
MKYFSLAQLQEAIRLLRPHHPIFATTFLVMKKSRVPVGSKIRFSLDVANRKFLEEHYSVHPKSRYFFRVMRRGNPTKDWNEPVYAGKGLQSVNTRGCPKAFLHDRNENTWGWSTQYVKALSDKLPKGARLPLFHIAAWLYKYKPWPEDTTRTTVVDLIIKEYHLNNEELTHLFDQQLQSNLSEEEAFQEAPVKWHQLLAGYSSPKDVPPEQSGFLAYLEAQGIGPTNQFHFEPARRLNIITGDNGLGKTFLLDLAWWALTQDWAQMLAWPMAKNYDKEPTIKFVVSGQSEGKPVKARLSAVDQRWQLQDKRPTISGLVVYARVDGSFAVWDPINRLLRDTSPISNWPGLKFTREEIWNGKPGQIEGLIRDWVKWQGRPDKHSAFETFQAVLRRVSPPDLGELKIGEPMRFPGEVREIPTLVHPYGTVPILLESAGVRRIVTLSYLIVWAWEEHKIQAELGRKKEERQMVVIIDEVEAHLHPKWQRVILPALLGIAGDLHAELSLQLIVATHSPLVLASSEPVFSASDDKLFNLEMDKSGNVTFKEIPFEVRGSIDSWLSSPVFQLSHPGSPEREAAIHEAIRLQQKQNPNKSEVEAVTQRLRSFLAPEDPFWVRWVFFAERFGVSL